MKLESIINVFQRRNEKEDVLILKVLNTIKDFKRRMDLKPAYREIKQVYEDYEEERQSYAKELIKVYCTEQNNKNKNVPEWINLDETKMASVPYEKMEQFVKEMNKRKNAEIELKYDFKFYMDEIERANLVFIEEELLDPFIDWNKNKPSPKKSK